MPLPARAVLLEYDAAAIYRFNDRNEDRTDRELAPDAVGEGHLAGPARFVGQDGRSPATLQQHRESGITGSGIHSNRLEANMAGAVCGEAPLRNLDHLRTQWGIATV